MLNTSASLVSSHHLTQSLSGACVYLLSSQQPSLTLRSAFLAMGIISFVASAVLGDIAALSKKYHNPWLLMLLIPLMEPLISFLLSLSWSILFILQTTSIVLNHQTSSYVNIAIAYFCGVNSITWLSQILLIKVEDHLFNQSSKY